MILTEMRTEQIPEIYGKFSDIVGDSHWKKRITHLRQEMKGNRFLIDYIRRENSIAFQLDSLRELIVKFGSIPPWEINNHAIYPAVSFAAQSLSIMEASPRKLAEQFKRRIHGAIKRPDDMRGLRLEFAAATHFARRGLKVSWPEMSGICTSGVGTFDLLVEGLGPNGLEVECKLISEDKGRKIHKQEVLNFYALLWPHLEAVRKGLTVGLSVVLTI